MQLRVQERDAAAAVVSHEAHARHVKDLNGLMQDLELVIFLTGTDAGRAVAKLMIMAFAHNTRLPVQVRGPPQPNRLHHRCPSRRKPVYHLHGVCAPLMPRRHVRCAAARGGGILRVCAWRHMLLC